MNCAFGQEQPYSLLFPPLRSVLSVTYLEDKIILLDGACHWVSSILKATLQFFHPILKRGFGCRLMTGATFSLVMTNWVIR
jgi:hypothetical protein